MRPTEIQGYRMSRTCFYACTVLTYFAVAGMMASAAEATAQNADQKIRSTYVLGPDDQFTVRGMHADEMLDKPFRVEADGSVRLPLIGTMTAGGLTIEQFELQLTNRLKQY